MCASTAPLALVSPPELRMPSTKQYKNDGIRPKSRRVCLADKAKRPGPPGVPLEKSVPVAKVMELILQGRGNISRVADAIGTCRVTIARMIDRHPELQEALAQARERFVDDIEEAAIEGAIDGRDGILKIFMLKTQGKKRGYDQSETRDVARDVANAAFEYVLKQTTES